MCVFSGRVSHVSGTNIFARLQPDPTNGPSQYLVYSMNVSTERDVAMILPLPVSSHAEDAVEFIALDGYPEFFEDMEKGFPRISDEGFLTKSRRKSGGPPRAKLEVHEVGDFIASYVPSLPDFERLDPRFRLPTATWDQLPQYSDWGFTVFQLKATSASPAKGKRDEQGVVKRIHPMGFLFPTRLADALYFPTLHIHDEKVSERAFFDHALYFQGEAFQEFAGESSTGCAVSFMNVDKAKGIIQSDAKCGRHIIQGLHSNRDIFTATYLIEQQLEYRLGNNQFWSRLGLEIAALAVAFNRQSSKDKLNDLVDLLAGIPTDAIPAFERALQEEYSELSAWAKDALALPGWKAEAWIAPLTKMTRKNEDGTVRIAALQSLGRIGADTETTITALIEIALNDPNNAVAYFDCIC